MSEYINLTDVLKTAEHILTTSVQNSAEFGRETEFQFHNKIGISLFVSHEIRLRNENFGGFTISVCVNQEKSQLGDKLNRQDAYMILRGALSILNTAEAKAKAA